MKRTPLISEPLLINVVQVAAMLGISERHVWRLRDRDILPRPRKLGHRTLWSRLEIVQWAERQPRR